MPILPDTSQALNFDDIDDDNETENENENVDNAMLKPKTQREQAAHVFATEALNTALTRQTRKLLKRDNGIYILHLPDENWSKHFHRAVRSLGTMLTLRVVTALEKRNGVLDRAGVDGLEIVQKGFSTAFISQDPENLLDEAVIAASDATIKVAPMSAGPMRKIIRRVTKGTARGITAEMTKLNIDIILSVIRPDLTARQCVENLQRAVDRQSEPPAKSVPLLVDLPLTTPIRSVRVPAPFQDCWSGGECGNSQALSGSAPRPHSREHRPDGQASGWPSPCRDPDPAGHRL